MVQIYISPLAIVIGIVGSLMIYRDAKQRGMDTADMWAVAFSLGIFIPPIIGSIIVAIAYFHKRKPRKPRPTKAEKY